MTPLLDALAVACTAAGLLAALAVLARTGRGMLALQVALDFWVAAGLMRLAGPPSWSRLGSVAAIVALRQLLAWAIRSSTAGGAGSVLAGLTIRPAWRRPPRPPGD